MTEYYDIIDFWFAEIDPKAWWEKDELFDRRVLDRFLDHHTAASRCELFTWRDKPLGRLAEIIVLDQFSRNMFRNSPESFAYDNLALCLAQEAIHIGANEGLESAHKAFLYMPFMHSESARIHEQAVTLFSDPGMEYNLEFELKHKAIIDRFGRYPHRNKILGRPSTKEELGFLKEPDSSF
ncbi:MAG: DUF924 family protein [Gammaproteobacteria bacterium]|nr:MAG: DUF924 family protein [Gammaproteobacteria bacterium]